MLLRIFSSFGTAFCCSCSLMEMIDAIGIISAEKVTFLPSDCPSCFRMDSLVSEKKFSSSGILITPLS